MATLFDVGAALVTICANAMYPNGTGQASAAGVPVRAFQGWPNPQQLDVDLLANTCNISVFPTATEENKTRYLKDWQTQTVNVATITASIVGQAVVIGGAMPAPFTAHNVSLIVNGLPCVYAVLQTDTLTSIASALAALAGVSSSGVTITFPSSARINAARIGATGTSMREIRRQSRVFQITVWANTPTVRNAVAGALDGALANINFLTMPDGTGARMIYKGSHINDDFQKAKLYRMDFLYSVEYATTQTEIDTVITQEQIGIALQNDGSTQFTAAIVKTF